jgi:proton-dependent oligopeptide transporter, POT family
MGTVFLSLAVANVLLGWLGSFYGRMSPLQFWALEAAVAAVGGVLAMLLTRPLERMFASSLERQPA